MNMVVIIPTIDPDERLYKLVAQLRSRGLSRFVIVDDGSSENRAPIFEELERSGARVLHHPANLGKGAAIKTALGSVRALFPEATHVVTVDGDGQHLPDDVLRVCELAEGHHEHVVIGVRDLQRRGVPLRSRIGNAFSSAYFKLDTGFSCPDTQTGLRAMPVSLIPFARSVAGTRYEYEMNFLTEVVKGGRALAMVPIEAVYEDNNAGSHFSAVRDSVRIYKQFLRFAGSSLACALADLVLFAAVVAAGTAAGLPTSAAVVAATVSARLVSGALNFALNRTWSFSDLGSADGDARAQAARYGALFLAQMTASALLVALLSQLPVPPVAAKMLVDGALFIVSYFIQRNWVFKNAGGTRALAAKGGEHADGGKRETHAAPHTSFRAA
ncbi:MAG: bifunctional glycosyltransferase family 2/GtrA family protein [Eggerthellaceae bacterium]|nr:bifunctional glycosyltransferase family 2/GtrA family protein [Eggerthellaceae bacterium]